MQTETIYYHGATPAPCKPPPETDSEHDLLRACARGDTTAWDLLFQRHYAPTIRFVARLGHAFSQLDLEEICQETFIAVIRKLPSFRGRSQFQTWLFRVALNKARDFSQRQRAAKRGGGQLAVPLHATDSEQSAPIDPPCHRPSPDRSLIQQENALLVGAALERLNPETRELIELRYFADLSYDEIAHALQLHPKTVGSRLSRALDRLAVEVRKLGEDSTLRPFQND